MPLLKRAGQNTGAVHVATEMVTPNSFFLLNGGADATRTPIGKPDLLSKAPEEPRKDDELLCDS